MAGSGGYNPSLRRMGKGEAPAFQRFSSYLHSGARGDLGLVTGPAWAGPRGGNVGGGERKVHRMLADSFLMNIPSVVDMLMIPDGSSSTSLALAKLLCAGTCNVSAEDRDIIKNVINCVGEGFGRQRERAFRWEETKVATACVRPPHLAISPLSSGGLAFKTTVTAHGISLQHTSPMGQKLSCKGDGPSAPAGPPRPPATPRPRQPGGPLAKLWSSGIKVHYPATVRPTEGFDFGMDSSEGEEQAEVEKQMVAVTAGPAQGKIAEPVGEVDIEIVEEGPPPVAAGDFDKVVFDKVVFPK
jgi:hypothetical protein